MSTLDQLNTNLDADQVKLEEMQADLSDLESNRDAIELDSDDFIDQYEESLDEAHGEFMGMLASYILKECDPIAYRCGLADYVSNQDVTECQEYKDAQEAIETLEEQISDLESDIEELKEEIQDLEEV